MRQKSLCFIAAILSLSVEASAQGLKPAEKKLVQSVEARLNDEVAALEKVVNIDSGTLNPAGVREVGRYFQ